MMARTTFAKIRQRNIEHDADGFFKVVFRQVAAVALFAGMSTLYVNFVSVYFAYYGFAYISDLSRIPAALFAILALTPFLRPNISEMSKLTAALTHLFFFIPSAVMFVYAGLFLQIFIWTIVIQAMLIAASNVELRVKFSSGVSLKTLEYGLLAVALVGLTPVIIHVGIFSLSFNISDVYERRAEASEAETGILGYIAQFGAQAALLLLATAFFNRRWAFMGAAAFMTLLYFGYTGHKSVVFWGIFLVGLLYGARFRGKFYYLVGGAAAFVWLVALIIDTPIGVDVANYLIRRTLFTPVLLNQYYVMFAEQFGFLQWSYSKVGLGLFEYTDTVSPTEAIGQYLTGSDTNSANTGIIGFGYLNAGHAGIALYLAVFLVLLLFSSGLAREKKIEMLGAAIMIRVTYFTITTSDLPAMVLSGGLGYSILLLMLYPSASKNSAVLPSAVPDPVSEPDEPSFSTDH